MMPTDAEFREAIAKEMKRKKTNGADTFSRLDAISSMLDGRPLGTLSTEHEFTSRILAEHFKSPFAHALHIKAVMHILRCLSVVSQVHPEAQEHWQSALAKAEIETKAVEAEIKKWFPQVTQGVEAPTTSTGKEKDGATPETIQKYVRDLAQMLGKLNVRSLYEVVSKPEHFMEELRRKCTSEGTLKNHISTILCVFKYDPKIKEAHPQAFERWSLASAEQRKRSIMESKMNAPSNSRQAENFVPLAEWQEALVHLMKDEDPHSSLEKSQALVFMSYACSMPPKRSDLGSVKILSQEILQQMISGEQVSVPRKTLLAKDVVWTAPTVFASNHIPDYADNQGQISRRFAFYHFRNFVRKPDPMLMTRIEAEIPALIGRFVKKYLAAAREHASKSFWDWCPKEVLKIQQELKSNMSYVGRLLALDKDHEDAIIGPEYDQKLVYTERSDHLSTPVMTLQKALKEWMTKAHKNAQTYEKINKEMMERLRWEVCDKNVCRHCDRHSSSGRCCDKYTREERTKKLVVVGLNLFHSSYVPAPPLTNPIDAIN